MHIFIVGFFFLSYFLRKLTTNFYVVLKVACSAQFWQRNSGNCREMKLESEVKLTIAAKRLLWKPHRKYLPVGMITQGLEMMA